MTYAWMACALTKSRIAQGAVVLARIDPPPICGHRAFIGRIQTHDRCSAIDSLAYESFDALLLEAVAGAGR